MADYYYIAPMQPAPKKEAVIEIVPNEHGFTVQVDGYVTSIHRTREAAEIVAAGEHRKRQPRKPTGLKV